MTKQQKRFQYYSSKGIQWTSWFNYDGPEEEWQLKPKLKNEYRTITYENNN